MTATTSPHYASGKICYVEIPATDVRRSAGFFEHVFGWSIRAHEDGSLAFDDTVGQVSGMWVTGRKPIGEAGLLLSIMVADAVACCDAIVASGGQIVQPVDRRASEITAWFLDPCGNLLGIYQQDGLADHESNERSPETRCCDDVTDVGHLTDFKAVVSLPVAGFAT